MARSGDKYQMSSDERRHEVPTTVLSRRKFLRMGLIAAMPAMVPGVAMAGLHVRNVRSPARPQLPKLPLPVGHAPRALSFYNLHTDERLRTVYWEHGEYVSGALDHINYILRDFRRNEIKPIDPKLLDLLVALRKKLDTSAEIDIISGYRSPKTNSMLHSHSEGVAIHSMHIYGKAIDIRVPGRELAMVRRAALSLQYGGVGFYPHSDFVHVDTGRVRHW
jgi:uncharacterized protein YcbK (DUF882 family)